MKSGHTQLSTVCRLLFMVSQIRLLSVVILYPSHRLTSVQNFTDIVPGKLIRQGLNERGVVKYTDVGPVEGYILETVKDKASGIINN